MCATIALIAKAPLLPLYRKAGFEVQGLSAIVHGRDPWFECMDATAFPYEVIDSFSSVTFGGNPAAVVLGEGSEDWMKGVAAEFNLSETAFLRFIEGNRFGLRWLTPTAEVDLCGHATLAAAHFLLGREPYDELIFETRSGDLVATKKNDLIELAFPSDDPMEVVDLKIKGQLLKALSVEDIVSVHRSGQRDLLVTLSTEAFRAMNVDLAKINEIERIRGVVPCCAGDVRDEGQADFSSRFFGPAVGIDEDPVTGSAHCALAPLFMKRCGGKRRLVGYQASARGGEVVCDVAGPLVKLSGRATAVMAGVVSWAIAIGVMRCAMPDRLTAGACGGPERVVLRARQARRRQEDAAVARVLCIGSSRGWARRSRGRSPGCRLSPSSPCMRRPPRRGVREPAVQPVRRAPIAAGEHARRSASPGAA